MCSVVPAGDKAAAGANIKEATALLLPAALAHLVQLRAAAQHAKHDSAHGTAASGQAHAEARDAHTAQTNPVRLFYEHELMVYLTARTKSPQGEVSSTCSSLFEPVSFHKRLACSVLPGCLYSTCKSRHERATKPMSITQKVGHCASAVPSSSQA